MPLFATTAELRPFYPARVTFDLEDLLPTIETVEQEYLVEQVLGAAQYADLIDALESDELDDEQEEVLKLCRKVVAPLAIHGFTGFGNVEFSSGGLVTGQTEHKRPASEWRTRDLERATLRQGYRALDVLIAWLLDNEDALDGWAESEQASRLKSGWLRGTQAFGRHVHIGNSGWLYMRMWPTMRRIEEGAIADTLCSNAVAEDLRTKWLDDELSEGERKAIDHLQKALVHLTMADSIVELSLRMDQHGIWTFATVLGQTSGGPMPASDQRLQQQISHHRNLGTHYLARLRLQLQQLADADPAHPYRSTTCYVQPGTEPGAQFQTNSPVGGFLG